MNSKNKISLQPLELILCSLLVSIVIITFVQVLFRYVFQFSLAWTEELARYIFLWLAALSIAYAFKTKSHFALTFLVDRVQKRYRNVIYKTVNVLMLLFLSIFVWKSFEYTLSVIDQFGPGTGLSMSVPYSSSIFGGILMIYYIVQDFIKMTTRNSKS
ncbi:MAG: TRAP transporter small permease [Candidatus Marinimicrobia bacterium]|jgi:TRAP-type C4-dicarboxylate transport system permease small subunit|nr:TRAP transporter small permease [Candidatus Neomarinimicrobiota bacterium]|tara:strand:- start:7696 stop:8169 length:474 start_codon:yes stop_codon:yes gene_type:complete